MFKLKNIKINVKNKYIVLLTEVDAKEIGLNSGDKITLLSKNRMQSQVCELDILDFQNKTIKLNSGEIGLFNDSFNKFSIKENSMIDIIPSKPANSLKFIKKKFEGGRLSKDEFLVIMKDIVENRLTDIELTYFVIATTINKLNLKEITGLTNAMVDVGEKIEIEKKKGEMIVDKHCVGGVPGNRTTLIVLPIIAALGLKMPKTSSRAITSPAGTADTMEVFANVEISIDKMKEIIKKENGCIIWGGGLDLSPADDLIIQVEHPLNLDSEGQMISSILSKKKSAGSEFVLIDIPYGQTAKVKNKLQAIRLKLKLEKVGKAIGLDVKVILTDGSQPIGNAIGAYLEAEDILRIFKSDKNLSKDLKEKSLQMAGIIIERGGKAKTGNGYSLAKKTLESGEAYNKFKNIIKLQGKKPKFRAPKFEFVIKAERVGEVFGINNKTIAKLTFILGAPKDKKAGIYLHKKVGDKFKKSEAILTIYSDSKLRLDYGKNFYFENEIIKIK